MLVVCLTIFMAGKKPTFDNIKVYTENRLIDRAFIIPFTIGILAVDYCNEVVGAQKGASIRPMAWLTDQEYLPLSTMRSYYYHSAKHGMYSPAGFLYEFQANFGFLNGFIISLLCLCFLDAALLLSFKALSLHASMLFLPAGLINEYGLVNNSFTVAMFTQGVLIPFTCCVFCVFSVMCLEAYCKYRKSNAMLLPERLRGR